MNRSRLYFYKVRPILSLPTVRTLLLTHLVANMIKPSDLYIELSNQAPILYAVFKYYIYIKSGGRGRGGKKFASPYCTQENRTAKWSVFINEIEGILVIWLRVSKKGGLGRGEKG